MIFRIKKYFKSKKQRAFNDELIDKLNIEHQKLFELVGKMDEAVEKNDLKKLKKLINSFKQELELHVIYEDSNLYEHLYLRYHYYPEVKEAIQERHNEINGIATAVENFINNHKELNSIDEFKKDFDIIKDVLVKRVTFEEEILYEIYATNQKIHNILKKLKREERRKKEN